MFFHIHTQQLSENHPHSFDDTSISQWSEIQVKKYFNSLDKPYQLHLNVHIQQMHIPLIFQSLHVYIHKLIN